jgi:hypothetical protein
MTAVEWLESNLPTAFKDLTINKQLIEQAKEMEKQQQDEFAIGFAEWLDFKYYQGENINEYHRSIDEYRNGKHFTVKELLEIYKKEK